MPHLSKKNLEKTKLDYLKKWKTIKLQTKVLLKLAIQEKISK